MNKERARGVFEYGRRRNLTVLLYRGWVQRICNDVLQHTYTWLETAEWKCYLESICIRVVFKLLLCAEVWSLQATTF